MSVENFFTIIFAVLASAIIAYITAKYSQKQFTQQNSKEDIAKAIELSELYALRILPLINYVLNSYRNNTKIKQFHDKINLERKKGSLLFTLSEMQSFFTESEIKGIIFAINPQNMQDEVLLNARTVLYQSRLSDSLFCTNKEMRENLEGDFEKLFSLQLKDEYASNEMTLLNSLEYFSMYFNSEIADEGTVYQSLHQTFIAIVTFLYFKISLLNEDVKDKYFTNVIELYNLWNQRFTDKVLLEEEHSSTVLEKPKKYK